MDLRKRLAQLDRLTRRAAGAGRGRRRRRARAWRRRRTWAVTVAPGGGTWLGARLARTCRRRPPLPDLAGPAVPPLRTLRPTRADLLFLDTETTGLAGGTGTLAFLVGLAWWEQGRLLHRQYFLPDAGP